MKIEVEIDNKEIQQQITEELDYLLVVAESMEPPLNISQIIVPADFEAKVRELSEEDGYKFQRGLENEKITAAAKIIEGKDGIIIVLAPFIYLAVFDIMVRCFILTHEFTHIMNKSRFPKIPKNSFALENYLENLYTLFDEYMADRFSFHITERLFNPPTDTWKEYNKNGFLNYLNPETHPVYYAQVKSEIEKFRNHGDVNLYWNSVIETVNVISISTVHGFATYHQHHDEYRDIDIPTTSFVDEKTLALMDYFKTKYENAETDLKDGVVLMSNYLTNFGVKFEDRPDNKGYVYVLDI
ncbi:MAG: hypothetical protein IPP66_17690 [Anaerolineales bacterium]|nr:hypothetical protein [Anaerolineales bacterium]